MLSLTDIAETRTSFLQEVRLSGDVVCPFVQKTKVAGNPLFPSEGGAMIEQRASRTKKSNKSENKESIEDRSKVFLFLLLNLNSNIKRPKKCYLQSNFPLHVMDLLFFHWEKFVATNRTSLLPQFIQLASVVNVFTLASMIASMI